MKLIVLIACIMTVVTCYELAIDICPGWSTTQDSTGQRIDIGGSPKRCANLCKGLHHCAYFAYKYAHNARKIIQVLARTRDAEQMLSFFECAEENSTCTIYDTHRKLNDFHNFHEAEVSCGKQICTRAFY